MNNIVKELWNRSTRSVKSLLIEDDVDSPSTFYPVPIDPSTHHTPDGQDGWSFQTAGGEFRYFKYKDFNSCVKAYEKCPPVAAIINRKAQAFINGKTFVLNSRDKEAQGIEANKLRKLLANPNPLQSWKQFEAQGYIYEQLFGFNIILPIKPAGFTDPLDTSSMWNIPANWIDIEATQENFTRLGGVALTEFVLNFNDATAIIKLQDVIIIKDFTPSFTTITFPGSKLMGMEMPVNNIIGAFESRNMLINYRGALGILTTDPGKGQFAAIPMTDPEKNALQRDFRKYGLRSKQFQVIMTTASLKWQSMGYPTKDLMLMEEVQESTKSLCDGFNFPPHLLGLIDPTFNNQQEAKKGLYEDGIIPDAESIYEQLTSWFKLERFNLRLDKDYSHLPALQKDKVQQANARNILNDALKKEFDAGLITMNQWLVELGRDPLGADGEVRSTDRNSNVPLAVVIGVGGVQGLIAVVTSSMSAEAKENVLIEVFGLAKEVAARMAAPPEAQNNNNGQQGQTSQTQSGGQSQSGSQQEG